MAKTKVRKTAATASKAPKPTAKPTAKPVAKPAAKSARAKKIVARPAKIVPTEELGASEVLGRLVVLARSEEEIDDEVPLLVDRLQATADASLVGTLFGALDDDDPHGVLWSIFYVLEGFDDAYLAGLLEALPDLIDRAPGWAETAVLRIVNTRGEADDCTGAFVKLAKGLRPPARKKTAAALAKMGKTTDGLHPSQRKALTEIAKAIAD